MGIKNFLKPNPIKVAFTITLFLMSFAFNPKFFYELPESFVPINGASVYSYFSFMYLSVGGILYLISCLCSWWLEKEIDHIKGAKSKKRISSLKKTEQYIVLFLAYIFFVLGFNVYSYFYVYKQIDLGWIVGLIFLFTGFTFALGFSTWRKIDVNIYEKILRHAKLQKDAKKMALAAITLLLFTAVAGLFYKFLYSLQIPAVLVLSAFYLYILFKLNE